MFKANWYIQVNLSFMHQKHVFWTVLNAF